MTTDRDDEGCFQSTPPPLAGGGKGEGGAPDAPGGPRSAPPRAAPPARPRLAIVGTEVLDSHARPLALLPAAGGIWRFRAGAAPPLLTSLLVAVEDRRFWLHPGVDPLALLRAT